MTISNTMLYKIIVNLLEERKHIKRNKPSLPRQLHDILVKERIYLSTKDQPMNVNSCAIWLNNIKMGRYNWADAMAEKRCGRTGAGKR